MANSAPFCLPGSPKEQGCVAAYGRDVWSKPTLVGYNSRLDIGALMTESSMVGLVSGFSSVCVISRGCEVCTLCRHTSRSVGLGIQG